MKGFVLALSLFCGWACIHTGEPVYLIPQFVGLVGFLVMLATDIALFIIDQEAKLARIRKETEEIKQKTKKIIAERIAIENRNERKRKKAVRRKVETRYEEFY